MMPMIDSVTSKFRTHGVMAIAGKNGNEKRRKPCVPIFSRTPARITEPAVGASTCASGSQVWNGHIGILTANEARKANHAQVWSDRGNGGGRNVGMWVVPACQYIAMMASSIRTEPASV